MHDNRRLAELAARHGVGTEYTDSTGEHVRVDDETLVAVLAALDVDASTPDAVEGALTDADAREWQRILPPSVVTREGWAPRIIVHAPQGTAVRVDAALEDGTLRALEQSDALLEPREIDGRVVERSAFELPFDLPKGWHELRAYLGNGGKDGEPDAVAPLAVTPQRGIVDDEPAWGLMTQLYQVRSSRSWGVGDLGDARTLARWGAERGADFMLLNPLHAPAPVLPIEPSPYLPTTRRFVDPSTIHVEDLPVFERLEGAVRERVASLAAAARTKNAVDDIDRDAMWRAKREALALCHGLDLIDDDRRRRYGDYCELEGHKLLDFATYCAIAEHHGHDWGDWPADLRSPTAPGVDGFRREHSELVDLYRWLQWAVDEQLERLQAEALDAGMRIGVVHDLAVGVHPQGADTWALPDAIARGVTVGAPPDAFNQFGQNWSQPPWRPDRLAESGYAAYREMLAMIFRHAGGVRIDHILGLFRLWWIPVGNDPDRGTYVRYDYEAMIGVLLLEAERAGARVIGEDLGLVEPHTRAMLAERGVAGTSILWWEWDGDEPLAPEDYRTACLAAVTTHDLPPTAGFLELAHVDLRERLGLLTRPAADERAAERASIDAVLAAVADRGVLEPGASIDDQVVALHRYLAASAANAFGVAVADLAGDRRSVNQPGTYLEYPNWSVPLSGPNGELVSLEALMASPFAARLAEASTRNRDGLTPPRDEVAGGAVEKSGA